MCFDNPIHYRGPAAFEHRERQHEAEERGWTGPEVAKRPVHVFIVARTVGVKARLKPGPTYFGTYSSWYVQPLRGSAFVVALTGGRN